ncbi:nuclease-related domain-containing protein [Labedella endophytica]|nr:nuclease-related domain-containing protein [Labedella endophytica]
MTEVIVAPGADAPGLDALRRAERRRPGQVCIDRAAVARAGSVPPSLVRRAFGGSPVGAPEREAFEAAMGERIVGRELDSLPDGWIVLHSIPAPGASGDLDHVVIGPPGLFAVTTCFVGGDRVFVAEDYLLARGERIPFARPAVSAARRTAQLAGRALPPSVAVRGVVAVAGARGVRIGARTRSVDVRDARVLREWLVSLPPALDAVVVEAVATRIAASIDAGSGSPDPAEDGRSAAALLVARLERESTAARRLRFLWRTAGLAAVAGGVWVAFAHLPAWLALHLG